MRKLFMIYFLFLFQNIFAQSDTLNPNLFLPRPSMIAYHASSFINIDGDITDAAWKHIPWNTDFQDITGDKNKPPFYKTKFKMLWDEQFIYIAAIMETPNIWASINRNDGPLFFDDALEIFADPDGDTHSYFELEINAFNKVMDLFMCKPYRNDGNSLVTWDVKGWQHEIKYQGTLNNGNDRDTSWTVEMAIPIASLTNPFYKMKEGTIWRMNFFRVLWNVDFVNGKYEKRKDETGKELSAHHWTWSPQGLDNIHYPERWGYVQFSKKEIPEASDKVILPSSEKWINFMWMIYYREQNYFEKNKSYTTSYGDLQISSEAINAVKKENDIRLECTSKQFLLTLSSHDSSYIIQLDQDSKLIIKNRKSEEHY